MKRTAKEFTTQLTLLKDFAGYANHAFWQRRRRGPRHANWSWLMESIADLTIAAVPDRPDIAVQEIRQLFQQTAQLPVPTLATITPINLGGVPGECQQPRRAVDGRVILFFHGGGYVAGSPASHRLLTTRIAKEAHAVLYSMAYRLAPEHPYPAGLKDAWSAYLTLLTDGVDPAKLVLGGDSAGAGLAIALMLALREAQLPLPAGAFCLSPFLDVSCETAVQWVEEERSHGESDWSEKKEALADYINLNVLRCSGLAYLDGVAPHHPYVSPLFAELGGLPPLLIQASTTEVLAGDAIRFAARARQANVDVQLSLAEQMIHVYQFLYHIAPEADEAVREIGQFVQKLTGTL